MSGKANRNQGVRIIAEFEDRAIPLNTPDGLAWSGKATRSANEGIRLFADLETVAQPLSGSETSMCDTLNMLFAQHEQKVQRLVKKLEETVEELKKQNADLKASVAESDQLLNRYHLEGPNKDEI